MMMKMFLFTENAWIAGDSAVAVWGHGPLVFVVAALNTPTKLFHKAMKECIRNSENIYELLSQVSIILTHALKLWVPSAWKSELWI